MYKLLYWGFWSGFLSTSTVLLLVVFCLRNFLTVPHPKIFLPASHQIEFITVPGGTYFYLYMCTSSHLISAQEVRLYLISTRNYYKDSTVDISERPPKQCQINSRVERLSSSPDRFFFLFFFFFLVIRVHLYPISPNIIIIIIIISYCLPVVYPVHIIIIIIFIIGRSVGLNVT